MKRILGILTLLAVLVLPGQLLAYSISLSPASQTIGLGGTALVDVNLSLIDETLYGFDLKLSFDPAILGFGSFSSPLPADYLTDYTYEPLVDPSAITFNGFDYTFSAVPTNGTITLASLSFTGINYGLSPLSLTGDLDLGNMDTAGNSILDAVSAEGNVNVVPEPGTFLLLGLGLAGLVGYRRKFQKA